VTIGGEVDGQIATFGGPVRMEPNSRVTGDIATLGASVHKEPGAIHDGRSVGFGGVLPGLAPGRAASPQKADEDAGGLWVVGTICGVLLALLVAGIFPNATRIVADAIMAKPGSAAAHGGLTMLLVVPVCFVLAITCVGLILVPVVILALIGAFILGTVGVELIVGRRLVRSTGWAVTSLIGLAVLGAVVLRLVAILQLLPAVEIVGVLVSLVVFIFGVGGALMTGFGTRPDGEWILRRLRRRRLSVEVTVDDADEPSEGPPQPAMPDAGSSADEPQSAGPPPDAPTAGGPDAPPD